jgi:GntR family transcriptional regulator, vanillate catabolism transcriptional regulator
VSTSTIVRLPRPIGQGAPLHSQVYEHLWTALIVGDLPPGTRLKDGDWATRLGISRTPVREAFRKLVQDGALDPQDSVGFRVHAFTSVEVLGLYRCRAALEALVAEEAAADQSPGLLSELAANIAAAQHALDVTDLDALQRLNGEFHLILLDASRNPHLRRLLEQTGRSVRMARGQVLRRATADAALREDYRRSLQPVVDDHRALHQAVTAGDRVRAASLMHKHLLETARDMTLLLRTEDASMNVSQPLR